MKTLLLLRHAKSSWAEEGLADHDRPLKKRGAAAARRMGRLLRDMGAPVDRVLCSTAVRAQETWRLAAEELKKSQARMPVEQRAELYLATPATIVAVLRALPDETSTALVVGHNPGLEELLAALIGRVERLPTGALAEIALPLTQWSQLQLETRGELKHLWRPKELDD